MEAIPLLDPADRGSIARDERDGLYERLPTRQRRVLQLVADGLSDEEVASRTGQTEDRVASMVTGLLTELGFQSRSEAISFVIQRDLARIIHRPGIRATVRPLEAARGDQGPRLVGEDRN